MNFDRHYKTNQERTQLRGILCDDVCEFDYNISKRNRMSSRANNLPDNSLVDLTEDQQVA